MRFGAGGLPSWRHDEDGRAVRLRPDKDPNGRSSHRNPCHGHDRHARSGIGLRPVRGNHPRPRLSKQRVPGRSIRATRLPLNQRRSRRSDHPGPCVRRGLGRTPSDPGAAPHRRTGERSFLRLGRPRLLHRDADLGRLATGTALKALTGLDHTVLHLEAVTIPTASRKTRRIELSAERYDRLAAFIERSFHRNGTGAVIMVPDAHYGGHDAFFEADGRYSILLTCNEWARHALSVAGVRVPAWSPFDKALLYRLPTDKPLGFQGAHQARVKLTLTAGRSANVVIRPDCTAMMSPQGTALFILPSGRPCQASRFPASAGG